MRSFRTYRPQNGCLLTPGTGASTSIRHQLHVTAKKPNTDQTGAAAGTKSPIVTRRRALTMAFRQALASLSGARNKATSTILDAAAELKNATKPPRV
jgi:hypothetical protein